MSIAKIIKGKLNSKYIGKFVNHYEKQDNLNIMRSNYPHCVIILGMIGVGSMWTWKILIDL